MFVYTLGEMNIATTENISNFHSSTVALYRKLIIIYGSIGMKI